MLNPAYPDKFRTFTGDNFRSRGIEFVLDDLVEDMTIHDQSVITKKGKKISADLVVSACLLSRIRPLPFFRFQRVGQLQILA